MQPERSVPLGGVLGLFRYARACMGGAPPAALRDPSVKPARGMMKKALYLALALIGCAACSPSSQQMGVPSASSGPTTPADVGVTRLSALAANTARPGFAVLPDRGDLVEYPSPAPARRDGAYTWHRAELSEAHAFQSLQSGSMRITSPSGRALDYEYVRHIEHPSGDWTWVGRLRDGAPSDQAVITFGERAAFGTIAEPGRPELRMVTRDGAAWIIETDPVQVAQVDNAATRPRGVDFLIPPKPAATKKEASDALVSEAAAPVMASDVSASATTVVDVVVGYTTGFAATLGGNSQALTRINNLVEISNQAYANSQIDARVRLVHAMSVSYPDNTANNAALEELTGYRSGSGSIAVPAALQPLRNARETYGGDLVTLVRAFRDPENDGCGIAWLLGSGRSGIDTSRAPYGYSIVSDGRDQGADGKTYFCREETFAHELGHNMGSQHDLSTATDSGVVSYGAYSYSFGYKTGSTTGNFYTVMAYGDSGQVSYRVFSNPAVTFCGGRACGVANQADNSRSLRQTLPIIAAFRASKSVENTAFRGDFNGDGVSDLLWRNGSSGANAIWLSANAATQQAIPSVSLAWTVVGKGDFDGDGRDDILWRNLTTGANQFWRGGSATNVATIAKVTGTWSVATVGDFNGDRRDDILWRNSVTGANQVWNSASASNVRVLTPVSDANWRVVGAGDFDGDGIGDVLWRHVGNGRNSIWRSASASSPLVISSVPIGSWAVAGVADVSGDGRADIVWRNNSTGANAIWRSGNSASQQSIVGVPIAWNIVALADYSGDGIDDLLWRNAGTGANVIWRSANPSTSQSLAGVPPGSWAVK